ncbi:hypothetical protein MAPG_03552 [Magnaporthiopsis poae ATCC 64411]|uniref:Uncharacterized protein n=1 Tax=Magnaporthiopsis poae (strain ATCC 64411 / 73-15) TaxID=644358 RepID=A0A0C4DUB4_MAGP6|nr:hypothetical protein MAPG_03552 [Magnaporthiopsis poae ATCC 64411]
MSPSSETPGSNPAVAYLSRHAARIVAPISLIELDSAFLDLAHPCFVTFCSGQLNGQSRAPRFRRSPTHLPAPDPATLCVDKGNVAADLAKTRVSTGLLVGLWLPQGPVAEATPAQEEQLSQARMSFAASPYSHPVIKPAEGQTIYPVCVTMNTAAAIRHRADFYVLTEPDKGGLLHGFWETTSMDDTYFFPAYRDDIMCKSQAARRSHVRNLVYQAFRDLENQDAQPLKTPKPPQPAQPPPARPQRATRLSTGAQARANYRYEPINLEMEVDDEDMADESTIQPVEEPVTKSVEPVKMSDRAAKGTAEDMADQDLLWVLIKNRDLPITKKAIFEAWEDFAIQHPDFLDSLTNGFETEEPSMADITAMVHGLRTVDHQVPIVYLRPWAYAFLEVWNKWPNMPENSDGQMNLASTVAKQTYSFVKGQLGRSVQRILVGSYGT